MTNNELLLQDNKPHYLDNKKLHSEIILRKELMAKLFGVSTLVTRIIVKGNVKDIILLSEEKAREFVRDTMAMNSLEMNDDVFDHSVLKDCLTKKSTKKEDVPKESKISLENGFWKYLKWYQSATNAPFITIDNEEYHKARDIPLSKYIVDGIIGICHGVTMRANFNRYSYREEMEMAAVETAIKYFDRYYPYQYKCKNFKQCGYTLKHVYFVKDNTETGPETKPCPVCGGSVSKLKTNAFGYFSQVAYNVCQQVIKKEHKAYAIKVRHELEYQRIGQAEGYVPVTRMSAKEKEHYNKKQTWFYEYEAKRNKK